MVGLLIAALGDLMVALAPTTSTYLLGRAIAGVGLGAVFGAAFAYIRAVAKPGKLPAAVGIFSAVIGLTSLVLTFVGAVSPASTGAWRSWWLPPCPWCASCWCRWSCRRKRVWSGPRPTPSDKCSSSSDHRLPLRRQRAWSQPDQPPDPALALGRRRDHRRVLRPRVEGRAPILPGEPVPLTHVPRCHLRGFIYNFGQAVAFLQVTNLWQYVNGLRPPRSRSGSFP